jgi:hypothetical protein
VLITSVEVDLGHSRGTTTADLNDSTVTLQSVQGETVPVSYCSRKERLLSEL